MTVRIFHERADQARYLWVHAPLDVVVDGRPYRAVRWSIAGVVVELQNANLLTVGQHVEVRVSLPFQGYDVSFPTSGIVEATDPQDDTRNAGSAVGFARNAVVVRFDALTNRDRELLAYFLSDLVQGRIAPVEDILRRIDVPVALTRLTPDQEPTRSEVLVRRPLRAVLTSAGYLALGAVILGYLATLAYTNLAWQEIPVAAVEADLEPVHARGGGTVALTQVKVGDRVKAGHVIARIVDPRLEREIRLSEIAVRERDMRWRIAEGQPRKTRRPDLPAISRADVQIAVDRQRELIAQRGDLDIKAPYDGIIAALPLATNASVRQGDVVVVFERGNRRDVTAYVTAAELERVKVGGRALVRIPGDNRTLPARVIEIVPNGALLDRLAGLGPGGRSGAPRPAERQANVRLSLDQGAGDIAAVGMPGQPVMVMLERQRATKIGAIFTRAFASKAAGTVADAGK